MLHFTSINRLHIPTWPRADAFMIGVSSPIVRAFISSNCPFNASCGFLKPYSMSSSTAVSLPMLAAWWRGVLFRESL